MGLGAWLRAAVSVPVPPSMAPPGWPQIESPWANPDILTRLTVADLWPEGFTYGPTVTRGEAMTVPAVAAARHRITGTLARLPIVARKDGAPWTGDTSLLTQPDPAEPHVATLTKTIDDLVFSGRAWWAVTREAAGYPVDAVHVPVIDIVDNDGWPGLDTRFTEWLAKSHRAVLDHPGPVPAGLPWLIEFTGPHEGLCSFGARTIRAALNLDQSMAHASSNPVPSVELHQTTDGDMLPGEIDDLIARWTAARQSGGVGYTNAAIELKTHGQAPEQLLIQGRNQQAVEIARLAGIPAASIDAAIPGASLTYANLVDRLRDLISFGLQPYAAAYTGRLSMADILPRGVTAELDYSELLPPVPNGSEPAATAPAVTP